MNDVLLKGGTVIDGEKRTEFRADVLVRDGVIAEIGENIAADGAETVNCDGLYLTAGFIDAHVHVESGMVLPESGSGSRAGTLPAGGRAVSALRNCRFRHGFGFVL